MPRTAAVAALILMASPLGALAAPDIGGAPNGDAAPPAPLPFFRRGLDDAGPDAFPGFPGLKSPVAPGRPALGATAPSEARLDRAASDGPPAPPPKPPTRAEVLDRLMHRLAEAQDPDEAKGIAAVVEHMWMDSGSDTADLLMTRALAAMGEKRQDVAAALLDKIIELKPGWAEAWNKRATLRFLEGDDTGSMEDISHVLAIEPRHFGALSGMGYILERHGEDAAALKAMRRALSIYPGDAELRKAVDKLAPTVEGQDL